MKRSSVQLLLLAPLLLVGCGEWFGDTRPTPQVQQQAVPDGADTFAPKEEEPWSCKGHVPEAPAQSATLTAAPTGHVEIKCEAAVPPAAPAAGTLPVAGPSIVKHADPLARKCRFIVQEASVSQVSVPFADAAGVAVIVHPVVAEWRVSVIMPSATVKQFLDAVRTEGVNVRWSTQSDEVRFGFSEESREERTEPRRERMLTVNAKVPMKQFGQAVCALLTTRGHVEVVGHHLFVTDVPDVLNRATLLARGLDEENPPTAVQWNAVYDNYTRSSQAYETVVKARRLIDEALSTPEDDARRDKLQQADQLLSGVKPPDAKLTAPAAPRPAAPPPSSDTQSPWAPTPRPQPAPAPAPAEPAAPSENPPE